MIIRFALFAALSVAAYALRQIGIIKSRFSPSTVKPSDSEETDIERCVEEEEVDELQAPCPCIISPEEKVQQGGEEKEEVKRISGVINPASGSCPYTENEHLSDKESGNTKDSTEVDELRRLVKELEEREVRLEGGLLEYYGLKEQEADILELRKQIKMKTTEIQMLNATVKALQIERKKLLEEVFHGDAAMRELELARRTIKELNREIQLEANQTKMHLQLVKQQVLDLQTKEEEAMENDAVVEKKIKAVKELEVEVMELKRKNIELQHEKRDLSVKLDAAESRITTLTIMTESEMLAELRVEMRDLRHANEDLIKQVEGLQLNRFAEVEELVYLRWVNACLRYELRNHEAPSGKLSARDLSKNLSPKSTENAKRMLLEYAGGETDIETNLSHPSSPGSEDFDTASIDSSSTSRYKKHSLVQKLKKWGKNRNKDSSNNAVSLPARSVGRGSDHRLRNSSGANDSPENPNLPAIRTQASPIRSMDGVSASFQLMSKSVEGVLDEKYPAFKDRHTLAIERENQIKQKADQARTNKFLDHNSTNGNDRKSLLARFAQSKDKEVDSVDQTIDSKPSSPIVSPLKLADIEKRLPRVPRTPPKPSGVSSVDENSNFSTGKSHFTLPPPPPLTPLTPGGPLKSMRNGDKVQRAPEVVEFYQTLMKREARKDGCSLGSSASSMEVRSNMIGEIQNRSSFLLAVKADVEAQGGFVQSLAKEVRAASFTVMEDLIAFVSWLDEELSFLVDERAVVKHFEWPEGKVDALREAAFEYQDLMKLEIQLSSFVDDPNLPCDATLKKMYSLFEKVEQSVYALLRTRDIAVSRYREFGVPVKWLLDSGIVGKIKLSSVQLARKYMKRVASELDGLEDCPEKEPNREFVALQGVRFAFRVHQFAGGFDSESMKVFEELRSRIHTKPR